MTVGRRAGILTFVVLLVGGSLLASLPFRLGAIRVGGVGLVWWFGLLVTPLVVALVVVAARLFRRDTDAAPGAALLASPAMVAAIVAHVFSGGYAGPLLVAAAVLPLVLIAGGRPAAVVPDVSTLIARLVSAGLLVWSNFLVAADLARVAGGRRGYGVAVAAAIALALAVRPAADRWRAAALAAGGLLLVTALVSVGAVSGAAPWAAWRSVATRSTLAFGASSAWVVDGGTVLDPSVLTFGEPHRVTTQTPVTLRVIETDGDRVTARDWRLAAGESVMLRPGDRLVVPPGVRLRFEPDRRVPGAPPSGVSWADPPMPITDLLGFLGAAVTLAGGVVALALVSAAPRDEGAAAPLSVLATVAAAAGWGLYGAFTGFDLGLGAPAFAPLVRLPLALGPWGGATLVVVALSGLALWGAVAGMLRAWVVDADGADVAGMSADRRRMAWLAVVGLAAVGAAWPADGWRAFALGCGFAGATLAVPAMAGGPPVARRLAAAAGAVTFAALAVAGVALGAGAPALVRYPALLAMPAAWGVAWVAAGQRD